MKKRLIDWGDHLHTVPHPDLNNAGWATYTITLHDALAATHRR